MNLSALNPWFLAAASVALVPLIIHLIERRRVQRVVFGSVLFLRGLVKRLARRRRTSELILLILRMVLLAVLAFAFARPFFGSREGASGEDAAGRQAVAILIDRSASMKIGTRMTDARAKAIEVIDDLHKGDVVAVYAYGAALDAVVPFTDDVDAAKKAVEELNARDEGTDLALALSQVNDAVAQRAEPVRRIVIVSDLQANAWTSGYAGDWKLAPDVWLVIKPLGASDTAANVGITQLAVPARAVLGSEPDVLTAQVKNYTSERRNVTVHLKLAGSEVDSRKISIPPESATSVSFRHAFTEPGEVEGRFVLTVSDDFPADDRAGFIVEVMPKIRVVLVNGSRDPAPERNDGYFLKRALAPSGESIFEVIEATPDGFVSAPLAGVSVIVLADVDDLPEDGALKLQRFVETGGGVMFFPGRETNPANFSRRFDRIAPCHLEREVSVLDGAGRGRGLVITEVDHRHPIFQPFVKPHHGDFSRVTFTQYFTVTDSQAADVLARFDNGKPAILLKKVGRGASLIVVSSADREMNDFPLRGVFLPFVHQAAKHLSAFGVTRRTSARVGEELVVQVPSGTGAAQLTTPSGATRGLEVETADDAAEVHVRFTVAEQGLYRLSAGGSERFFAASVDPAEGNLTVMQPNELSAAVTSRQGEAGEEGALVVTGHRATDEEIERRQRIGWMLLVAAAVLMAAEMALAMRITAEE